MGQENEKPSLENAFDFWLGSWKVSWLTADNTIVTGTNEIAKTLDGKVIQEHFSDPNTGFKGTSISVFSTKDNTWRQAWADNQGGYLNLIGIIENDKRIFQTHPEKENDKTIIKRMVFYNIADDDFTWDWELSENGGVTWKLLWRINYERIE